MKTSKSAFVTSSFGGDLESAVDDPNVGASIGDILRRHKSLSPKQIEEILMLQRERGIKFGEAAVALKYASERDVLWALSQQFHYPFAADDEAGQYSPELVVAVDPFGRQAEVFRDIRSQVMMGVLGADEGRRALAIISPGVGDGKTFFAANLAVAFSQLGGRTLLVDADMRTPRMHTIFDVAGTQGLSSVLAGRAGDNVIMPVPNLPSLFMLPVGTVPPNPLELVQRPAFTLLMHELLGKFDFIIVDTPAAEHGSDARVIASKCGAALAIGRKDATSLAGLEKLLAGLRKGATRVAGVAVNEY